MFRQRMAWWQILIAAKTQQASFDALVLVKNPATYQANNLKCVFQVQIESWPRSFLRGQNRYIKNHILRS